MLPAAHLTVDPAYTLAEVDDRLYSSFIEHLGRAVYDGIYCPDHPTADADGFRQDVVDLIRPLQPAGILQPSRRQPVQRPAHRPRRQGAFRHPYLVPGQRDGRPLADRP